MFLNLHFDVHAYIFSCDLVPEFDSVCVCSDRLQSMVLAYVCVS